jgi:superfamily II DNA or RNA helicase
MTDLTIDRLANMAGASIFDRGQQYLRSGRVLSVTAEGTSLRGRVKGSDQYPYRVEIDLRPDRPVVRCTCPFNVGPWCKHAVAVALSYCLDGGRQVERGNGRGARASGQRNGNSVAEGDRAAADERAADAETNGAGHRRRRRRPRRRRRHDEAPGADQPFTPPRPDVPSPAPMSAGRAAVDLGSPLLNSISARGTRQLGDEAARRFRFRVRQASDGLELTVVEPRTAQPVVALKPLLAGHAAGARHTRARRRRGNAATPALAPAPPVENVKLRRSDELLFHFLTQRGQTDARRKLFKVLNDDAATLLHLLSAAGGVYDDWTGERIVFAAEPARLVLDVDAAGDGVTLRASWRLPASDKPLGLADARLFSGDVSWLRAGAVLCRATPRASALASQLGIAAEQRLSGEDVARFLFEVTPDPAPGIEIRLSPSARAVELKREEPKVVLTLAPRQRGALEGRMSFDYRGTRVSGEGRYVRADDRLWLERDESLELRARQRLLDFGFAPTTTGENTYVALGDAALDFVSAKLKDLAKEWQVYGADKLGDFRVTKKKFDLTISADAASGIDWFTLDISAKAGDEVIDIATLQHALLSGERYLKLSDGTNVEIPRDRLVKLSEALNTVEARPDADGKFRVNLFEANELATRLGEEDGLKQTAGFRQFIKRLQGFEGIGRGEPPKTLKATLRPYQQRGLDWLWFLNRYSLGGVLADDMGLGKAQPLRSLVLTPEGWRRMGDLEVGDLVVGADGRPTRVAGVFPQGEKEIYRVTFSDGSSTDCCDEHLWLVNTPQRKWQGRPARVFSVRELLERPLRDANGNANFFIPMVRPVEFAARPLPLDPYVLGCLIGDGGLSQSGVNLSSADAELLSEVGARVPSGVAVRYTGFGVDYRLTTSPQVAPNPVKDALRRLGLMGKRSEEKFIPEEYLFASVEQRVALLQGLLDTDGHVRPKDNNVEFSTASPRLAEGVRALVQSLGGTARIREKVTARRLAYRMSVALPAEIRPFRLSRKADVYHPRTKYQPTRAIVGIERIGREPAQCIAVDAHDHLYVTEHFVVTHNTVQSLGVLLKSKKTEGRKPSLVVVPASVVVNWQEEAEKFAPSLDVLDLTGPNRNERFDKVPDSDLCITNYALLRRDVDRLAEIEFRYVILDEAQNIKNPESQTARASKRLRADHRLALTGTPIENRLSELWSICDFLTPGLLGSLQRFRQIYEVPIATRGDREAEAKLRRRVYPFILRRMKQEVADDLPEKIESMLHCDLLPEQRALYRDVLALTRKTLFEQIDEKGIERSTISILAALLKLRQVCCHPRLLKLPVDEERLVSAKMDLLQEMVHELVSEGHRALIFSQFTEMLAIMREWLDEEQIEYEYLDGSTKDRADRVRRFNEDPTVPLFLISLKAGGTGLNLTGADYVIHYDPWWNPAVEDQATDRAYRIGQTRNVFAYKLICKGTVEDKLVELQQRKRELVAGVLGAESSIGKALTREDLEDLFSLDE